MITTFISFLLLQQNQARYIFYDSGNYTELSNLTHSNFICQQGSSHTRQINFAFPFLNTPKILVSPNYYVFDQDSEFIFTILNKTEEQWSFNLKCTSGILGTYMFTWIAMDTNNIYVIDAWNNYTDYSRNQYSNVYPIPSLGVVFNQVITNIVCIGVAQQQISGLIYNSSIDQQQVTVTVWIEDPLKSLGYQIVLGTADAFSKIPEFTVYVGKNEIEFTNNDNYIQIENKLLYSAINWIRQDTKSYDINFKFTVLEQNSYHIKYVTTNYGGAFSQYFLTSVLINIPTDQYPLQLQKMRVSQLFTYKTKQTGDQQELIIQELDQNPIAIPNVLTKQINKNIAFINIKYNFECQIGQQIRGYVLKCNNCQKQKREFTYYCFEVINMIQFHFLFYPRGMIEQNIDLNLSQGNIQISQNIGGITYIILNIDILD